MNSLDSKENRIIQEEFANRIRDALEGFCSGEARIMFVSKDGTEQKCCKTMLKDSVDGHTLNMTVQIF